MSLLLSMTFKTSKSPTASAGVCSFSILLAFFSLVLVVSAGKGTVRLGPFSLTTANYNTPDYIKPKNYDQSFACGLFEIPLCIPFNATAKGLTGRYTDSGVGSVLFGPPKLSQLGCTLVGLNAGYVLTDIDGESKLCAAPLIYGSSGAVGGKSFAIVEDSSDEIYSTLYMKIAPDTLVDIGEKKFLGLSPKKYPGFLRANVLIDETFNNVGERHVNVMKKKSHYPAQRFCANVGHLPNDLLHFPMVGIRRLTDRALFRKDEYTNGPNPFKRLNSMPDVSDSFSGNTDESSFDGTFTIEHTGSGDTFSQHSHDSLDGAFDDPNEHGAAGGVVTFPRHHMLLERFLENADFDNLREFLLRQEAAPRDNFGDFSEQLDFFTLQYLLSFASSAAYRFTMNSFSREKVLEVVEVSDYQLLYLHQIVHSSFPSKSTSSSSEEMSFLANRKQTIAQLLRKFMNRSEIRCQYDLKQHNVGEDKPDEVHNYRRSLFARNEDASNMAVEYIYDNDTLTNLFDYTWKAFKSMLTTENIGESANFIRKNASVQIKTYILYFFARSRLRVYLSLYRGASLSLSKDPLISSYDAASTILRNLAIRKGSFADNILPLMDIPDVTLASLLKVLLNDRDLVMIFTCLAGGLAQCPKSLLLGELSTETLVDAFLVRDFLSFFQGNKEIHEDAEKPTHFLAKLLLSPTMQPDEYQHHFFKSLRSLHTALVEKLDFEYEVDATNSKILKNGRFHANMELIGNSEDFRNIYTPNGLNEMNFLLMLFGANEYAAKNSLGIIHDLLYKGQDKEAWYPFGFVLIYKHFLLLMTHVSQDSDPRKAEDVGLHKLMSNVRLEKSSNLDVSSSRSGIEDSEKTWLPDRLNYVQAFRSFSRPARLNTYAQSDDSTRTAYSILRNVAEVLATSFVTEYDEYNIVFSAQNSYLLGDRMIALKVIAQPTTKFDSSFSLEDIYDYFHLVSNTCFDALTEGLNFEFLDDAVIDSTHTHFAGKQPDEKNGLNLEITALEYVFFSTPELKNLLQSLLQLEDSSKARVALDLAAFDLYRLQYLLKDTGIYGPVLLSLSRHDIKDAISAYLTWYSNIPLFDFNPIDRSTFYAALEKHYEAMKPNDSKCIFLPNRIEESVLTMEFERNNLFPNVLTAPLLVPGENRTTQVCTMISNMHEDDYLAYAQVSSFPKHNMFAVFSPSEVYQYVYGVNSIIRADTCIVTTFSWSFSAPPKVFASVICPGCDAHPGGLVAHVDSVGEDKLKLCIVSLRDGSDDFIHMHTKLTLQFFAVGLLKSDDYTFVDDVLNVNIARLVRFEDSVTYLMNPRIRYAPLFRLVFPEELFVTMSFRNLYSPMQRRTSIFNIRFIDGVLNQTLLNLRIGIFKEYSFFIAGTFKSPLEYNVLLRFSGLSASQKNRLVTEEVGSIIRHSFINTVEASLVAPSAKIRETLNLMKKSGKNPYEICFDSDLSAAITFPWKIAPEQYTFTLEKAVYPHKSFALAPVDIRVQTPLNPRLYMFQELNEDEIGVAPLV